MAEVIEKEKQAPETPSSPPINFRELLLEPVFDNNPIGRQVLGV
mgnify:FL=1